VFKAYRFQLSPNESQAKELVEWFGAKRFIWNRLLSMNLYRLENGYGLMWNSEMSKYNTLLKQSEEYRFLRIPAKDVLQGALRDLEKAFKDWFDKKQPLKRKPRFKSKHDRQSFQLPSQVFKVLNNEIKLPKMKEAVKFRRSRRVKGEIRNATISFDGRKWWVSIMAEVKNVKKHYDREIGIDVGVKRFVTLSDGTYVNPINFEKDIERLAHAQVIMARKEKGSAKWSKAKATVQKHMRHIADKRKDFLHKLSTELAKSKTVYIEDLNIKGMTASAAGTIEEPGKNVAQKRGLNRSIIQQGWGMFFEMLAYKLENNNGKLVKVNTKHTSQTCSKCGHTDGKSRKDQATFKCVACNHDINADHNAALNILTVGQTGIVLSKGGNHALGE
jgi:IS605 OrfB family transposase